MTIQDDHGGSRAIMQSNQRVLMIAPSYRYFVKGIADAIASRVDSVSVLVPHNVLTELLRYLPPKGRLAHFKDFTSNRLIDRGNRPQNLEVQTVDLMYLRPDRHNSKVGDILAQGVERTIRSDHIRFDTVLGYFTWPAGYAAVRVGKRHNATVVVVLGEDQNWLGEMKDSRDWRFEWTWRNASALVRNNSVDLPLLGKYNHVFPAIGGFDPQLFFPMDRDSARRAVGLPSGRPIVFAMGTLEARKGFQYLVAAMEDLVRERPAILCVIGGEGRLRGSLERQVKKAGLRENVIFAGKIPHEKAYCYYNAANVFVLPSLGEGNPNVMFEALACGTPFVGTPVGGVPEIITSEDYGFLISPADANDLKAKIVLALDKRWDRGGLQQYAQHFTLSRKAEAITRLFQYRAS